MLTNPHCQCCSISQNISKYQISLSKHICSYFWKHFPCIFLNSLCSPTPLPSFVENPYSMLILTVLFPFISFDFLWFPSCLLISTHFHPFPFLPSHCRSFPSFPSFPFISFHLLIFVFISFFLISFWFLFVSFWCLFHFLVKVETFFGWSWKAERIRTWHVCCQPRLWVHLVFAGQLPTPKAFSAILPMNFVSHCHLFC